jgi:hypothetical protein
MKCSDVRQALIDRNCGEVLTPKVEKQIGGHIATCAECQNWQAYHQAFVPAAEDIKIAPFSVSEKVLQAIEQKKAAQTQHRPKAEKTPWWQPWWVGAAAGVAFASILIAALLTLNLKNSVKIESYEIDGHRYQVVWLDNSAEFNPADIDIPDITALQPSRTNRLRIQLGILTDELADALHKKNWNAIRDALKAQKMELPTVPPKQLVISGTLADLLQTETRDVELWVIQPTASMLVFRRL